MINHKILRLKSLGLTHREIADSAGCGRNTVTRTLARAREQQLSWKQVQLEAYLFVAVLSYSGYAYTEAFLDIKQEAWIAGHVNAYRYFGGVTRILTPDNLKTGVLKNSRTETVLNKSYQEMAEHYGTAILPARPRLGATGAGKTYLACALGMAASRSFYSVRYIRLPVLLVEISVARANGTYRDYMKKLKKENCSSWMNGCSTLSRRQRPGMCWSW